MRETCPPGAMRHAPAQAGDPVSGEDIRDTINQQLNAFQRDDWAGAFSYASPALQTIFGSPDRFRDMVLGGYRAVYRPKQVTFRDLDASGPRPAGLSGCLRDGTAG